MRLSDFGNFPETWKIVTVRYREDSEEMRITYANSKAWKTLSQGKTDYPEGAMFAKIGVRTGVDPDFPSSRVPQESKRFQFMVRSRKYKETGGWGYSIFRKGGETYPDDERETLLACYTCHQIVGHRGEVFSELGGFDLKSVPKTLGKNDFLLRSFVLISGTSLPDDVRKETGLGADTVYFYRGPVSAHVFAGTVDEMRPALLEKARLTGKSVFFVSDKSSYYVGILPGTASCEDGKKSWVIWQRTMISGPTKETKLPSESLTTGRPFTTLKIEKCL